jgi:UDP-N-acetylmuramoyl-L-alanyl-D-glutamate--2,6-diaminopimelate ligase
VFAQPPTDNQKPANQPPLVTLRALRNRLDDTGLLREQKPDAKDVEIAHLAHDSRRVEEGGLFVAIRGTEADGHDFIDDAVAGGAEAIVCEHVPPDCGAQYTNAAILEVHDSRKALAELAAAFFDDPARSLRMIGITGTNGKTTTTWLIHHVLQVLNDRPTGLLGTIAARIGEKDYAPTHTTPDPVGLHWMLARMVEQDCAACVMEVSSHALAQDRTRGLPFEVAVFTNLTQDHLDYHDSLEAYRHAKKQLFDDLSENATALYNTDDEASLQMVADTAARRRSYGQGADADLHLEVLDDRMDGLRLRLDDHDEYDFQLVGAFNAYNLAAAYGACCALGYDEADVLAALTEAPPVPGRFEQFRFEDGRTAIVDYAHTPDALENVLQTTRSLMPEGEAALWCVFGCGGDRDRTKRRLMGALAERYADRLIITSDNPRTEEPRSIINDIRRGMDRPAEASRIVDRREAIRKAAVRSEPGDVVLVAGKGHETYQEIDGERRPFDDREEVRNSFGKRTPAR